jgi:hypothetical protein
LAQAEVETLRAERDSVAAELSWRPSVIPASDTVLFDRCKAMGGFVDYQQPQGVEYGAPSTEPSTCEVRP